MSSNKSIRQIMEMKYGKKCMIEASGIRYIPIEKRRNLRGYKKTQEQLTYHHIREKSKGGKTTEENGALLKEYNHVWLHSLPENVKEQVNEALQQYKLRISTIEVDDTSINIEKPIELDFDLIKDYIEIPLKEMKDKKKEPFNRAKIKRETKKIIEELDLDDYYL